MSSSDSTDDDNVSSASAETWAQTQAKKEEELQKQSKSRRSTPGFKFTPRSERICQLKRRPLDDKTEVAICNQPHACNWLTADEDENYLASVCSKALFIYKFNPHGFNDPDGPFVLISIRKREDNAFICSLGGAFWTSSCSKKIVYFMHASAKGVIEMLSSQDNFQKPLMDNSHQWNAKGKQTDTLSALSVRPRSIAVKYPDVPFSVLTGSFDNKAHLFYPSSEDFAAERDDPSLSSDCKITTKMDSWCNASTTYFHESRRLFFHVICDWASVITFMDATTSEPSIWAKFAGSSGSWIWNVQILPDTRFPASGPDDCLLVHSGGKTFEIRAITLTQNAKSFNKEEDAKLSKTQNVMSSEVANGGYTVARFKETNIFAHCSSDYCVFLVESDGNAGFRTTGELEVIDRARIAKKKRRFEQKKAKSNQGDEAEEKKKKHRDFSDTSDDDGGVNASYYGGTKDIHSCLFFRNLIVTGSSVGRCAVFTHRSKDYYFSRRKMSLVIHSGFCKSAIGKLHDTYAIYVLVSRYLA